MVLSQKQTEEIARRAEAEADRIMKARKLREQIEADEEARRQEEINTYRKECAKPWADNNEKWE